MHSFGPAAADRAFAKPELSVPGLCRAGEKNITVYNASGAGLHVVLGRGRVRFLAHLVSCGAALAPGLVLEKFLDLHT